jgi:uncharacterized protein
MRAPESGADRGIAALLEAGADPNRHAGGWSPLHHAIDSELDSLWQSKEPLDRATFQMAERLLRHGADPDARTSDGETARDMVDRYSTQLAERFDRIVESACRFARRGTPA